VTNRSAFYEQLQQLQWEVARPIAYFSRLVAMVRRRAAPHRRAAPEQGLAAPRGDGLTPPIRPAWRDLAHARAPLSPPVRPADPSRLGGARSHRRTR
jgi:hypothetical protein